MERGLSFEDLKLDGEGTFCLKVSSWMRGDFRLKISSWMERGLSHLKAQKGPNVLFHAVILRNLHLKNEHRPRLSAELPEVEKRFTVQTRGQSILKTVASKQ